ncbi:Ig-like domain-containing protein [Halorussus sp. AFM4]|uniref:Ig-like domain-containing protein n=1 Tax=Halorussus sp. AFM4 TaxID=3421651 RepID=UPI003EBE0B67
MRLRTDDRGVTVQVGTVLLFAVVVVLLSTYQASVVPQQNEQVEFDHNQRVQGQLQDLRDELLRTAATGSGGSSSVALGTRYPVRAVFVNPAPPSGTLSTTSAADIVVKNAKATGETGDYWTGDDRTFATKGLTYEPNYHVYQNPPTTVYRNSVLYNRFENGARLTVAGQQVVEGDSITLVTLDGSLSKSSSGTASVNVEAVSTATRTITVRNENPGESVTVVVPTVLSAGKWEQLLADELDPDSNDPERYVSAVENAGAGAVRIAFEPGTYELRLAKVGVGTGVPDVDAHYVTDVRGDGTSVPTGGTQKVVVEVRDRYNNPVAGATVEPIGVSAGSVSPAAVETDSDGRATFVYHAPADAGTETVTLAISDSPVPREKATVEIDIEGGADGGGTDDRDDGAYWTRWENETIRAQPGMTCYANDTCRYDLAYGNSVTLTANTTPVADGATVAFSVNDTDTGQFAVDRARTASDGRVEVDLDQLSPGNVTVYASSGGTGDRLAIETYDSGGGPSNTLAYNDDGEAVDSPEDSDSTESSLTFSVSNEYDQDVTITDVTVDPQNGFINRLSDPSTDEGKWHSELYVEADVRNGGTDIPGGTDLPTTIDVDADGHSGASVEPVASSNSDATIYLYKFRRENGGGVSDVAMNDRRVEITLRYELADGTTDSVTFTVDPS